MPATLTVRDESAAGAAEHTFELTFPTEHITVEELIRERVYQEVQDYNRDKPSVFRGLVQPTPMEQTLNGAKQPRTREVDWRAQFDKAREAFKRNGFLVLVGDRQAASLDEVIEITRGTEVSFLKLVPLVGG